MKLLTRYIFSIICSFSLLVILYLSSIHELIAISPSFPRLEIIDPASDLCLFVSDICGYNGTGSSDIRAINYISDGKFLNATLWLASFNNNTTPGIEKAYGILINADSDNKTGMLGIDYKVEILSINGTWTKIIEEWSSNGDVKTLSDITPYNETFFEEGRAYVMLSADLSVIHSPSRYKVIFYAEEENTVGNPDYIDHTNWINIPPSEFIISTSPNSLLLKPGEDDFIKLQVNSTIGIELEANLYHSQKESADDVSVDFIPPVIRIPPYGTSMSRLQINILQYAEPGPRTIHITINSTLPSDSLLRNNPAKTTETSISGKNGAPIPPSLENNNVVEQPTSFPITIKRALTQGEIFKAFWNDYGEFITYFGGIVTGTILPGIAKKIKFR
jgi:hypothetical protein